MTKILPVFYYPLGLSLTLSLAGLLALLLKRARTALVLLCLSVTLLWACAAPVFSRAVVRSLESRFHAAAEFPAVSAIVVLGGGEEPPA